MTLASAKRGQPDEPAANGSPSRSAGRSRPERAVDGEQHKKRRPKRRSRWFGSLRDKLARRLRATVKLGSEWLDRPMASLHLLLAIFALLLGFGLLMVLSSSAVASFNDDGSSFSVFANQATYAVVGLLFFGVAQYLPVRLLRSASTAAVVVSLVMLVAVLVPGVGTLVNGARSWVRIGGFQFQPSEIAKLALLLWAAHVMAHRRSTLASPKTLLIPVLPVFAIMAGLIMLQPDLGTTVALSIVFLAVLFFAGAPWWMFGSLGVIAVLSLFWLAISADYRLARLLSFIDPESHPETGYQLLQSLYGLGNGGWFGVGLGQSRAKWSYLPNADSDFIFAIVGEELGLIGAGILILLFALLAYTGLRIAHRNVDPYVKIVASAATVWLVGQAAINIGYVVGLLPVTGIPLPMISAGGTSLLMTMVVFGLLANFARSEPEAAAVLNAGGGGGKLARFLGIGASPRIARGRPDGRVPGRRPEPGPARGRQRAAPRRLTPRGADRRERSAPGAGPRDGAGGGPGFSPGPAPEQQRRTTRGGAPGRAVPGRTADQRRWSR